MRISKYILELDEPEAERCPTCDEPMVQVDAGIGEYECRGARGVDTNMVWICVNLDCEG